MEDDGRRPVPVPKRICLIHLESHDHDRGPTVRHVCVGCFMFESFVGPVSRLLSPRHENIILASIVAIISYVPQTDQILLIRDLHNRK